MKACIGKSVRIIKAIILLTQADLHSQFHPSEIWEDKYLFGPNNVVLENDYASQIYISELLEFKQELNSIKKQIDEEIEAKSAKNKVFQIESNYLEELSTSLDLLNLELILLSKFYIYGK